MRLSSPRFPQEPGLQVGQARLGFRLSEGRFEGGFKVLQFVDHDCFTLQLKKNGISRRPEEPVVTSNPSSDSGSHDDSSGSSMPVKMKLVKCEYTLLKTMRALSPRR